MTKVSNVSVFTTKDGNAVHSFLIKVGLKTGELNDRCVGKVRNKCVK